MKITHFNPNQSAPSIYIMIELCYFSLDQWEIRIHLLWGKSFNIPLHCDPHLNQTKWLIFNDLLPLTIPGVLERSRKMSSDDICYNLLLAAKNIKTLSFQWYSLCWSRPMWIPSSFVFTTRLKTWSGVRSYVQCGCNVLAKFWGLVGCSKRLDWSLKLTSGPIAFRICMTCYRWKSTVFPGKLFSPKKRRKTVFLGGHDSGVSWLWEELYAKLLGLGQL